MAPPEVFITPFRMQLLLLCVSIQELYSFFGILSLNFSYFLGWRELGG